MRLSILGCVLLSAAASGCAGPTGPVMGDWRGHEQSIEGYHDRVTELILDGGPADSGGTYHLVSSVPSSGLIGDRRNVNWSDRWSRRVLTDRTGAPYTVYHLNAPPPDHLADYALLSTGALLPVIDPLHPDLGRDAMLIALAPLPPTSWGYGRP